MGSVHKVAQRNFFQDFFFECRLIGVVCESLAAPHSFVSFTTDETLGLIFFCRQANDGIPKKREMKLNQSLFYFGKYSYWNQNFGEPVISEPGTGEPGTGSREPYRGNQGTGSLVPVWFPCGSPLLGTGYWVLGTGYWVLGTGYWVLGTGYWVLGTGQRRHLDSLQVTVKIRYVNVFNFQLLV